MKWNVLGFNFVHLTLPLEWTKSFHIFSYHSLCWQAVSHYFVAPQNVSVISSYPDYTIKTWSISLVLFDTCPATFQGRKSSWEVLGLCIYLNLEIEEKKIVSKHSNFFAITVNWLWQVALLPDRITQVILYGKRTN